MTNQNTAHWIETKWTLPKTDVDELSALLSQLGCLGNYEIMALMAEDEEKRTVSDFVAYFPDSGSLEDWKNKLSVLTNDNIKLVTLDRIPQAEWATEWKKYFKPFFLTPTLVIRPSWEDYTPVGDEKVITMDPGMAFGTGQHDTTRFCSEILCDLRSEYPNLNTLLDVGCGSGILSIIAKKVGFSEVTGIDNDPAAVETSLENLERNPDLGKIEFFLNGDGGLKDSRLSTYDVVVSNIIAETLAELKNDLVALVKPNGLLVLSGILPQRAHLVTEAFGDLELLDSKQSADWHAYVYRKK